MKQLSTHLAAGLRNVLKRSAELVRDAADTVPVLERLRDLAQGRGEGGKPRIMIVGEAAPEPAQWLFDATVVEDLSLAIGEAADLILLSGPLPANMPLAGSANLRQAAWDGGATDRPVQWDRLIATQASRHRADLVYLLHATDSTLAAVPSLVSAGRPVIASVTGSDLPLAARARGGSIDSKQRWIKNIRAVGLILTTSTWESEALEVLTGSGGTIYPYLRGVDLSRFSPAPKPDGGLLRLLYVSDRGGSLSQRYVLKAARDLEPVPGIEFTILSPQPGRNTRNVVHGPLVPYDQRAHLYASYDALIAPVECSGFSQSLMEALASGCAVVAPKSYFGDYSDDSPLVTYSVRPGHLAASLLALHADRQQLKLCQERSRAFAQSYLDRMEWGRWLIGCIAWLGAANGTLVARERDLRNA